MRSIFSSRFGIVAVFAAIASTALYAQAARKSMGLSMQGAGTSVFITHVDEGGPADKAGLKEGDEIQAIAGIPTARLDPQVLRIIVDTAKVMKFVVLRDNKKMSFSVVPGMYAPPRPKPQPMLAPPGAPRTT
jgi:predicted metalloprotease with PDZ domain